MIRRLLLATTLLAVSVSSMGCMDAKAPKNQELSAEATKWLDRARASFKSGDIEDARDAAESARKLAPDNAAIKVTAARVHLARLEFSETIKVLEGVEGSEARGIRGRAHWYAGEIDAAADELEAMLQDPGVKDEWAKVISRLARKGAGRKPFVINGSLLAVMPILRGRSPHMVVPVEIDGEQVLALISTAKAELVLDNSTRKEPSWVQIRFDNRVEVSGVPALTEDLSGISKDVGAPVRALIGANLLRRLNPTFDFSGEQFVVRTRELSPPPRATRVPLFYGQGGAMLARVGLKVDGPASTPIMINTQFTLPLVLDEMGFKTAGIADKDLTLVPQDKDGKLRTATLKQLKLGAFNLPAVPAFTGPSFEDARKATGIDIEGAVGSGILGLFRCSLTDGGRTLWIEDLPEELVKLLEDQAAAQGIPLPGGAPPPAGSGAPGPGAPASPPGSASPVVPPLVPPKGAPSPATPTPKAPGAK